MGGCFVMTGKLLWCKRKNFSVVFKVGFKENILETDDVGRCLAVVIHLTVEFVFVLQIMPIFLSLSLFIYLFFFPQNQLHTFNDVCNNESLVSDTET